MELTQKIELIDTYFRDVNYYPDVPFVPFAAQLADVAMFHTGPQPLFISTACALVEMESGGKNVFGCDNGSKFCNQQVTKYRVTRLKQAVRSGAASNGVGLTQITYFPYIIKADLLGGAHIMRNQMIVGFNVLNDLLNAWEYRTALEAYNDGKPLTNDPFNLYDQKFAYYHSLWKERLN